MEQMLSYIGAVGGLAGIAAILAVLAKLFKDKREHKIETMYVESKNQTEAFRAQISAFQTQMQIMQVGFDGQLKALTESVNSWKGLWETSANEIRELKMEIKELRIEIDKLKSEIDKLRTENAELKGQLKEHYKLA